MDRWGQVTREQGIRESFQKHASCKGSSPYCLALRGHVFSFSVCLHSHRDTPSSHLVCDLSPTSSFSFYRWCLAGYLFPASRSGAHAEVKLRAFDAFCGDIYIQLRLPTYLTVACEFQLSQRYISLARGGVRRGGCLCCLTKAWVVTWNRPTIYCSRTKKSAPLRSWTRSEQRTSLLLLCEWRSKLSRPLRRILTRVLKSWVTGTEFVIYGYEDEILYMGRWIDADSLF